MLCLSPLVPHLDEPSHHRVPANHQCRRAICSREPLIGCALRPATSVVSLGMTPSWLARLEQLGLAESLLDEVRDAEESYRWLWQHSGEDLFRAATADLHLAADLPYPFGEESALELGQLRHSDLVASLGCLFPIGVTAANDLADQIQLRRAFADPLAVTRTVQASVENKIADFPRTAADLRLGRNPGDVLDPFLLSANFEILSHCDLTTTIQTAVTHKALMKIEDLVGNLHQSVISRMRGNFRVPEPRSAGRGEGKEELDYTSNPFPGADVGQVPNVTRVDALGLFQVKSKTGSAKGGDGKRLGEQLRRLEREYGASTYYAAVVGNTLRGHRSMGAVVRESPQTAVLVGEAALSELTGSQVGAEPLLRTYQRAFSAAQQATGYDFLGIAAEIAGVFRDEAKRAGEDFLSVWLHASVSGSPEFQDSRKMAKAKVAKLRAPDPRR